MMSAAIYSIYESNRCIGENELPDIFEDYFDLEDEPIPVFESDEYWQFVELVNQTENEYFWSDLNHSLLNGSHFLITGRLGWYAHNHKIKPFIAEGINEAINDCLNVFDADNCEVAYENGSIIINTQHHDGNNWFEVRRLTEKGISEATEAINADKRLNPSPDWFAPLQLAEIDFGI